MNKKAYISNYTIDESLTLTFRFSYTQKLGVFYTNYDSNHYPVYDGKMYFWDLSEKVNDWLLKKWKIATKGVKLRGLYFDKPVTMQHSTKVTRLTNNYCPVCLQKKSYFENHHCVERSEGGPDGHKNVLRICGTCHAIITRGCLEERWPMSNTALFHQVMYFGMEVYPREFRKINHKDYEGENKRKAGFEEILKSYDGKNKEEKDKWQTTAMAIGRYFYQFYRDISGGIRSWKKAAKLYPTIYKEFEEVNLL